ncbi:MAG: GHKL domain-containing protein [Sphingobacteriales bacterium]|nr:MAG: GHKL domain-containing protein [Sphingobacteriales bacterium]
MKLFNTVYILLLCYIIAALVFWGFSLQKQSGIIFQHERSLLGTVADSSTQPLWFASKMQELEIKRERRTKQYIGEGSTFLLIIFIGAAVVYSSFRRSIRLSRQQNNFMLSVTHELKSPIAAMKLNLQTLERHNLDAAKREQLLARCIKEADRLNDLCNNILLTSQIEGRQYVATRERIDFADMIEESVLNYNIRYPDRMMAEIGPATVIGDNLSIQMAVNNILENAIKYTPADKVIKVHLQQEDKNVVLKVIDEGTGIPDNEKRKVFNKFYRIGNEDTRRSKGTGLGLYLTSKIMQQHNGKISVSDNPPTGSVFELVFPAA